MKHASGLDVEAFEIVGDFVERMAGGLREDDRRVHSEHPLVVLPEQTLEAVTRAHLPAAVVGFTRGSEERLVAARRNLEDASEREPLQLLLFAFEALCPLVRRTGYTSANPSVSREYFVEAMPRWLESMSAWAHAEGHVDLAGAVDAAIKIYLPVADEIVDDE